MIERTLYPIAFSGDWGRQIARRVGHGNAAQLYRGHIFEYLRWGYLGWLPATVLTRHALETIGPFLENYRSAADYRFLGKLFRHFRANMITIPSALKHDVGASGGRLAEEHAAAVHLERASSQGEGGAGCRAGHAAQGR